MLDGDYHLQGISYNSHVSWKTCLQSYKAFWVFLLLSFFAYFSFAKHVMHGHIRERKKKYPIMLSYWYCTFALPKYTDVISWLGGNSGEMITYAFFLGFLVLPVKKSYMSVKYKRLLNLTHHKHKPQSSLP